MVQKLLVLLIGLVIFSSAFPSLIFAKNSSELPDNRLILAKNTIVSTDYFAANETIVIQGTITGDTYLAGDSIRIDGHIKGDLLVTANTLTIKGMIDHDVRFFGKQIIIEGTVGGNISTFGQNITIKKTGIIYGSLLAGAQDTLILGTVKKDLWIGGETLRILGSITGNIHTYTSKLTLASQANITGNIEYTSTHQADIAREASVSGKVTSHISSDTPTDTSVTSFFDALGTILKFGDFIFLGITGLLLLRFIPHFVTPMTSIITTRPARSLFMGIGTLVLIPFISFILLVTIIGIPILLLLLPLLVLLIIFGEISISYFIGYKLISPLRKTTSSSIFYMSGLLLYSLVSFLPVTGGIIHYMGIAIGMGALLMHAIDSIHKTASRKTSLID